MMEVDDDPAMAYGEDAYGAADDQAYDNGDYNGEYYGGGDETMLDLDSMPVTQEDAWAVISAYFDEKGLVRQQLDSFNEFIQNTMQELVDDSGSDLMRLWEVIRRKFSRLNLVRFICPSPPP
jgi:hypothetical protein